MISATINLADEIRRGGTARDKAIAALYRDRQLRSGIKRYVLANKGNEKDAEDVFQEGIILLDRNIRTGKYQPTGTVQGYLTGICKYYWMNQIRKNRNIVLESEAPVPDETDRISPETLAIDHERKGLLKSVVNQLEGRCRAILRMWQLSFSMEEIAQEFKLKNPLMARKAKYRCMKDLVNYLDTNPQVKASLKSMG